MRLLHRLLPALLLGATTLHAQKVLYVEHEGRMRPVHAAHGLQAGIEDKGEITYVVDRKFALGKGDEYLPAFISVRNLEVRSHYLQMSDGTGSMNHTFEFRARFESAYRLENTFLVLELQLEHGGKTLFLHEIGRLDPHQPKPLHLSVPLNGPLGEGRYQLHLFAGGLEVLHSEQPFAYRESVLDKMVAKRIAGLKDAGPQPFIGPVPEYPPKLMKAKAKGRVLVRLHIRSTGAVIDPEIVETTDPAFGEATLTALRQWRFLPRMKAGHPVETVANMPITFEPPDDAAKKP